ncbi:FRIGIDA-like protein 4a [Trifolium pratense]|uniref:FRIGIDA-like protein 4a n=1 Tax=Trifolium pratense TaxID=57577 RepID=UPI001E697CA9|nr:FRIGIDA-like protein 4a [Trifolium pratense]
MGSIPDPGELSELTQPSFDDFQRQTSLMTSCTLLWKELSDHFSSLEQHLLHKSEALNRKIRSLDNQTNESLNLLRHRESTLDDALQIALRDIDNRTEAALAALSRVQADDVADGDGDGEVDNGDGLMMKLKSFCLNMDSLGFWGFVIGKKKELEGLRAEMPDALGECIDPAKFVLEAISEVFPVDKRGDKGGNDLGWACVLVLESLVPVMVDPVLKSRMLVTPSVKELAKDVAEKWKVSLEERGGVENVKTPDVHTFLQHLVTFGIVDSDDLQLYRKLVIASAWRKHMPKLALSLGLSNQMPDMIEELISKGQQLDAVHFTFEVGLVDKFPPVPLLKSFLKDAKKVATSILEDPNNAGRAAYLAARKEQSALKSVIKCIEEYNLEAEFPPENLKKRLEQLEKVKPEKRKQIVVPANKRTRASNSNGGPMPPAKAGRLTNAYVSSFPAAPTFVRSPSHGQYPAALPPYPSPPHMYGSRSPSYAYSPEPAPAIAASYPAPPMNYPAYGSYGNVMAPTYQQAYYR